MCYESAALPKNYSPKESQDWLELRLIETGIGSLAALQLKTGIHKGTLSKYFRQQQRPSVDVVPVLCEALEISPETLLVALGVIPEQKS